MMKRKMLLFAVAMTVTVCFASQSAFAQSGNKGSAKKGNSSKGSSAKTEELKVGDKAPDFEVTTFEDAKIKLSERFGDEGRPVILLFSRANW